MTLRTPCGRELNARGLPYISFEAIVDHIHSCNKPKCVEQFGFQCQDEELDYATEMANDIGADLPDGAWHALRTELGDW